MKKIGIIGCGLVGSGWAIVFARAGLSVKLFDSNRPTIDHALHWISDRLADMKDVGLLDDPKAVMANITGCDTLEDAASTADYIQESVLERLDVKKELFTRLDTLIPAHAVIASSTSGIPASSYTAGLACRTRCLVVHPVNPPYLVPLVELVPSPWTDRNVVETVHNLMHTVGQKPITVNKEIEGFVLNRLQGVLLMEAWRLVEEGVVSVADLDLTMSHGLGLRWGFMGPFEAIDLNAVGGVADYARRLGPLYQSIAASRKEFKLWDEQIIAKVENERREALPASELVARAAWRDRKLMKLARDRQSQDIRVD